MAIETRLTTEDGAAPQADTGDMRAEESITVDGLAETGRTAQTGTAQTRGTSETGASDPRANAFHHADASRAAARRLGRKLGERVLGQPAASEDTGS